MKKPAFSLFLMIFLTGCTHAPNSAATFCSDRGHAYELRNESNGSQTGFCVFGEDDECEGSSYYMGECGPRDDHNCTCELDEDIDVTCIPNWSCSEWSNCGVNEKQYRTCVDLNTCGEIESKPTELDNCTYISSDLELCGNAVLDLGAGEECDDGNIQNGDGCTEYCTLELCGDGVISLVEECDDGNNQNGDGCTNYCTLEICGNAILNLGEECDDGNIQNGDGCTNECSLELCGNGILNPTEECDDGNNAVGDGCTAYCTLELCGNAVLDLGAGEECDDGNGQDGDGCSSDCSLELCGDGVVDSGEECDDGNTAPDDGCTPYCTFEPGYP